MRSTRPMIAWAAIIALTSGCSDDARDDDPQVALTRASELLTEASSVRFALEGDDLPDRGTVVISAEGVAAPPASFSGEFRIQAGPLPATVAVVSIDGQLWAHLPLTSGYEPVDPDDLGVGDPGRLMDPDSGVARLLTAGTDVAWADRTRIDGTVYDQVEATLPGELVGQILTIADPGASVEATWALEPDTGRLAHASLTGPFYAEGHQTYTVHLDDYDEPADIRAPT